MKKKFFINLEPGLALLVVEEGFVWYCPNKGCFHVCTTK